MTGIIIAVAGVWFMSFALNKAREAQKKFRNKWNESPNL
jgi:hypothetical protein